MDLFANRIGVNSLFGAYTVNNRSAEVSWDVPDTTNQAIYDKILRGKEGLQNKIKYADNLINAIADPEDFIARKRGDLAAIAEKLSTEFRDSMLRNMQRNLPIKEVRENVKKDVDEKYDKLMKFHHQDFPEETLKRIVKKMTGGN